MKLSEKEKILSGQWPYYPLLPMIRRVGSSLSPEDCECGFLVALDWHIIYRANLILLALHSRLDQLTTYLQLTYESLDTLLADGWKGD